MTTLKRLFIGETAREVFEKELIRLGIIDRAKIKAIVDSVTNLI